MVPELSREQKLADEQAFTAAQATTIADVAAYQAQAAGFMDREAPGDVTAGQDQLE